MKKVLLASTALAMTAGMAAADVDLTGYAEIGIAGYDFEGGADETVFHSDLDVTFTLSGETDGGLTFGATIDLDEVGDDDLPGDGSGAGNPILGTHPDGAPTAEHSVFVSGDFGTITMGDTDGALDWAMAEVWWGTSLNDDHTVHIVGDVGLHENGGLDGIANGQVARYDYSFGDFAFAISAEIGDGSTSSEAYGIGAKYTFAFTGGSLGIGAGYQDGEQGNIDADIAGISLDLALDNGINARFNYSDGEAGNVDVDGWALGLAYVSGPLLVEANYGEQDGFRGAGLEDEGFGLAVNYDLGGGAVVMVGYGDSDVDGGGDYETWSAGLGLSF